MPGKARTLSSNGVMLSRANGGLKARFTINSKQPDMHAVVSQLNLTQVLVTRRQAVVADPQYSATSLITTRNMSTIRSTASLDQVAAQQTPLAQQAPSAEDSLPWNSASRIVIGFRGTRSVEAVKTDFSIKLHELPTEYGKPNSAVNAQLVPSFATSRSRVGMLRSRRGAVEEIQEEEDKPEDPIAGWVGLFEALKESVGVGTVSLLDRVRVHKGFLSAYLSVREQLHADVGTLMNERRAAELSNSESFPSKMELLFTGHSLGGAVATLAALDFTLAYPTMFDVSLYVFGSPRVGNRAFANYFNQHLPKKAFRFAYNRDGVTEMPPKPPAFHYKHVGIEVLLDEFGNFVEGPSFLDKTLIGSKMNPANHLLRKYLMAILKFVQLLAAYRFGHVPLFEPDQGEEFGSADDSLETIQEALGVQGRNSGSLEHLLKDMP
eukprot:c2581_g1_i2.p1 GENE.c2581_g1_i2~~c2581_g1_i2.p1  ORF type:complete len:436 (+),score=87.15 c2581_g1_i2:1223-2530(+)